jgi:hypothetical protein
MRLFPIVLAAIVVAAPALAQVKSGIEIKSEVQAVKVDIDAKGNKRTSLVPATTVVPGTPLVYWIRYRNGGVKPATSVVINNAIGNNIWFTDFGANSETGIVSVDGGKTFGPLTTLKIKYKDGTSRAAQRKDVTNVRWTLSTPIKPGGSGVLSFYAVVQ